MAATVPKPAKKSLLDEGEGELEAEEGLKVNEEFAKFYEDKKKHEELTKLRDKLRAEGKDENDIDALLCDGEEDDEEEEEDSDAEADTPEVMKEFLTLIPLLAAKEKPKELYDPKTEFFVATKKPEDEDEEEEEDDTGEGKSKPKKKEKPKEEKPLLLSDYVRQQALKRIQEGDDVNDEDPEEKEERKMREKSKLTHAEEQLALKEAFKRAAEGLDAEDGDAEDLLAVRTMSAEEAERDAAEQREFEKHQKAQLLVRDMEILNRYWNEQNLDENERFLRNYILNGGWIAKDGGVIPPNTTATMTTLADQSASSTTSVTTTSTASTLHAPVDSDEEEAILEKTEEFERKYNFRFEEPGSEQIISYARTVEDSVRRKSNKRKLERERRKQRKEAEKQQRAEEVKRLKNIKKEEIYRKLQQIRDVGGLDQLDPQKLEEALDIEGEFDPEEFDRRMAELFNEQYYSASADAEKPEAANEELERMLEEYYRLDFEDVVGGDTLARFKYRKVKPQTYGFTLDDILTREDKELNRRSSFKKVARPYVQERKQWLRQKEGDQGHGKQRVLGKRKRNHKNQPNNSDSSEIQPHGQAVNGNDTQTRVDEGAAEAKQKKKRKRRHRKKQKTESSADGAVASVAE